MIAISAKPSGGRSAAQARDVSALKVRIELGSRMMDAQLLSKVDVGSVLELDARVDDCVGVYADGQLVARGEAVVVDPVGDAANAHGKRLGVMVREIVALPAGHGSGRYQSQQPVNVASETTGIASREIGR